MKEKKRGKYCDKICVYFAHTGMNPSTWHASLMQGILYEIAINKVITYFKSQEISTLKKSRTHRPNNMLRI